MRQKGHQQKNQGGGFIQMMFFFPFFYFVGKFEMIQVVFVKLIRLVQLPSLLLLLGTVVVFNTPVSGEVQRVTLFASCGSTMLHSPNTDIESI